MYFQERGVGAFPPNFVVTTMMDVAAVRAHDKNPIMCSSCEDKLPAAARCIECMDFLCHDCRNAHMRLRLTKTHRVSALSLLSRSFGIFITLLLDSLLNVLFQIGGDR